MYRKKERQNMRDMGSRSVRSGFTDKPYSVNVDVCRIPVNIIPQNKDQSICGHLQDFRGS